ncbi:MAG TPA: hypothetical protein VGG29_11330 [Caulobacteraceae bacterium]|jgi:hypothetical protein
MRKLLLIAGMAALAVPSLAAAQTACMGEQHASRIAGTVTAGVATPLANDAALVCADYQVDGGYYDADGVWHETAGAGHYDADGNWVGAAPPAGDDRVVPPPAAGDYSADVAYAGAPGDISARESWLEQRIHEGDSSGALSRGDAEHDFDVLAGVRQFQSKKADENGGLSGGDKADILNKLDNLTAILRSQWRY